MTRSLGGRSRVAQTVAHSAEQRAAAVSAADRRVRVRSYINGVEVQGYDEAGNPAAAVSQRGIRGWKAGVYLGVVNQSAPHRGDLRLDDFSYGPLSGTGTRTESFNKADGAGLGPDLTWATGPYPSATDTLYTAGNACAVPPAVEDLPLNPGLWSAGIAANYPLADAPHRSGMFAQVTVSRIYMPDGGGGWIGLLIGYDGALAVFDGQVENAYHLAVGTDSGVTTVACAMNILAGLWDIEVLTARNSGVDTGPPLSLSEGDVIRFEVAVA